jgi:hypothetical protein
LHSLNDWLVESTVIFDRVHRLDNWRLFAINISYLFQIFPVSFASPYLSPNSLGCSWS